MRAGIICWDEDVSEFKIEVDTGVGCKSDGCEGAVGREADVSDVEGVEVAIDVVGFDVTDVVCAVVSFTKREYSRLADEPVSSVEHVGHIKQITSSEAKECILRVHQPKHLFLAVFTDCLDILFRHCVSS